MAEHQLDEHQAGGDGQQPRHVLLTPQFLPCAADLRAVFDERCAPLCLLTKWHPRRVLGQLLTRKLNAGVRNAASKIRVRRIRSASCGTTGR
jgi:hypothetical protein